MGYYNGCEKTLFVMIQGVIGAFLVRIPIVYIVIRIAGATLFQIGLGTPASSILQLQNRMYPCQMRVCIWKK